MPLWLLASLCSCDRWCKKVLTEHLSFAFFRKSLAAVRKSIYFYAYNSNQTMKKPPLIIALLLLAVSCTRYPSAVERTLRFAGENRVELSAFYDRPDVDVRSLYAFEDSLFKTLDFSNLDMYYDARNISASYLEALLDQEIIVGDLCMVWPHSASTTLGEVLKEHYKA